MIPNRQDPDPEARQIVIAFVTMTAALLILLIVIIWELSKFLW